MTTHDEVSKQLTAFDNKSLYEKLGALATKYPGQPAKYVDAQVAEVIDVGSAGPLDEIAELGKRILRRWSKVVHDLVCGGDVDAEARKTIFDAIKLGSPAATAAAITGVLISVFSVGPAIAAVVGALLGKLLLPAAGEEICQFWNEHM